MSAVPAGQGRTDREILGHSRYRVAVAAFFAMLVISPYEYSWSSISGPVGDIYGWSDHQVSTMFTLFIVFQSVGMLPGGLLRDRFGPRRTTMVAGVFSALGLFAVTLGPSYGFVLVLWCIGSFFTGFIYNNAVTTGNKWFRDRRGVMTGVIAGAFSWGSIPFIFWIRGIPDDASEARFFAVIYAMTALVLVVTVIAARSMEDPPKGWTKPGWVPQKAAVRRTEHEYTLLQTLRTWQMWVLMGSFVLISGAGLAGLSRITDYASSFGFAATAGTAAAAGIAIANGFGKLSLGWVSERLGTENTMVGSFVVCGVLLLGSVVAGEAGNEALFLVTAIAAIFFWASLFSLFPVAIGHYYGTSGAGANYGALYAVAKGTGGVYGGIITSLVITGHGFSTGFVVAGCLAIVAGLMILPLRAFPVVWRGQEPEGEVVVRRAGDPPAPAAATPAEALQKTGVGS